MLDLRPTAAAATAAARSRLRTTLITALSLVVVLAAVLYVLAPGGASISLDVRESAGAEHYDAVAAPRYTLVSARQLSAAAPTQTIYGKVEARGIAVSSVTLTLKGAERATKGLGARISIGKSGVVYRSVVHLKPGSYQFVFTLQAKGSNRTKVYTRVIRDGLYYRVSAVVRPNAVISFLPVSTY